MKSEGVSIAYRDLLLGVVGLFTMIIMALSLWVNEPETKNNDGITSPGDFIVSTFWDQGPIDVDLWLTAPGETKPVGFSNLQGVVWNLLRDDRGTDYDLLPMNFENAFSRGKPEGKYSVLVYCFNCSGKVDVIVKIERRDDNRINTVFEDKITLNGKNDWRTVLNFFVDSEGNIYDMNKLQENILK